MSEPPGAFRHAAVSAAVPTHRPQTESASLDEQQQSETGVFFRPASVRTSACRWRWSPSPAASTAATVSRLAHLSPLGPDEAATARSLRRQTSIRHFFDPARQQSGLVSGRPPRPALARRRTRDGENRFVLPRSIDRSRSARSRRRSPPPCARSVARRPVWSTLQRWSLPESASCSTHAHGNWHASLRGPVERARPPDARRRTGPLPPAPISKSSNDSWRLKHRS